MGRMVISCRAVRRVLTRAALLPVLGVGAASAQAARTMHHLPLRLMDLRLAADTLAGVHLFMEPSARSKQAHQPGGPVWLRFHPDTVQEWINGAATALRAVAPNARADGIQWSRTLPPRDGKGGVSVGRERKKGALQKQYWVAIADSLTGWRAELSGRDADSLLQLFLVVGTQSRVDTLISPPPETGPGDAPVSVLEQLKPDRGLPKPGRVAVMYVVGTDGLAEPESFAAFVASDPQLPAYARAVVLGSRFRPATRAGQPVRRLVLQVLGW